MFVHLLTPQQQISLIRTAEQLIASDNVIAKEEEAILQILRDQISQDIQSAEKFELSSIKQLFDTKKQKIAFLMELVGIALIDEEFHSSERSLITEIASLLNVSDSDLKQVEEWVLQQMALQKLATKLMES